MSSLQPFLISGSDQGLQLDNKSYIIPDKAFANLEDAYVWRERVKKRDGIKLMGRLRRVFTGLSGAVTPAAVDTITIDNIWIHLSIPGAGGQISGITNANPGVVTTTANHGLLTGDTVLINNVTGMTEVNGNTYTVTFISANSFSINDNTTGFGAYAGSGDWFSELNAELEKGSLSIVVGAPDTSTFTDDGDGTFTVTGAGVDAGSYINYVTGEVVLTFTGLLAGGGTTTFALNYFPTLPSVGICQRERSFINFEQAVFFDTRYAYIYDGTDFSEFLAGTNTRWNGTNSDFFWSTNFSGSDASIRQMWVTNFVNDPGSPLRYTDGTSWTDFNPVLEGTSVPNELLATIVNPWTGLASTPLANFPVIPGTVKITVSNGTDPDVLFSDPTGSGTLTGAASTNSGTINYTTGAIVLTINPAMTVDAQVRVSYQYENTYLWTARLLVPYYGRLLAFNTFEGTTQAGAKQYFNRLRFSQIGDPTQTNAWVSTVFGKGGFIDAPTNQAIISAKFFKNTLIVFFERSTWQLRYQGDYGLPFIWERISADLGCESQFSSVLFDDGILGVGDKAIITATGQGVQRIDSKIPDTVFGFKNANDGIERVHGIRDFKKELVYWTYVDTTSGFDNSFLYPNKMLLFNYRNGTWAKIRNNFTCFGQYQSIDGILWNRTDIFWDDFEVKWGDQVNQTQFPFVVGGNQEGFCHIIGESSVETQSLTITAIDRSVSPLQITIPNHNLKSGEMIYLDNLLFLDTSDSSSVATDLNDAIYKVEVVDVDNLELLKWVTADQGYDDDFDYVPANGSGTYIGCGEATILPNINIRTKDFNPFIEQGKQMKMSYFDFLIDRTDAGEISVNIYSNTTVKEKRNALIGQEEMDTQTNPLFNTPDSDIIWKRFYATVFGQFISLQLEYNDDQINNRSVYNQEFVLNSIVLWSKSGGRLAGS